MRLYKQKWRCTVVRSWIGHAQFDARRCALRVERLPTSCMLWTNWCTTVKLQIIQQRWFAHRIIIIDTCFLSMAIAFINCRIEIPLDPGFFEREVQAKSELKTLCALLCSIVDMQLSYLTYSLFFTLSKTILRCKLEMEVSRLSAVDCTSREQMSRE